MKPAVKGYMLLFIIILMIPVPKTAGLSSEQWKGIDESVVEKYAKEQGREARGSFINTDKGDLLLFVFLSAGAVAGFVAGYYWRVLVTGKAKAVNSIEKK